MRAVCQTERREDSGEVPQTIVFHGLILGFRF